MSVSLVSLRGILSGNRDRKGETAVMPSLRTWSRGKKSPLMMTHDWKQRALLAAGDGEVIIAAGWRLNATHRGYSMKTLKALVENMK